MDALGRDSQEFEARRRRVTYRIFTAATADGDFAGFVRKHVVPFAAG